MNTMNILRISAIVEKTNRVSAPMTTSGAFWLGVLGGSCSIQPLQYARPNQGAAMRQRRLRGVTLFGALLLVLAGGALLPPLKGQQPLNYVPNEILVKLKPEERDQALLRQLPLLNAFIRSRIPALGVDVLRSRSLSTEELMEKLRPVPAVEYVEPNYYLQTVFIPNDTFFPSQWGLTKIRCPQAWDVTTGNDTVVAVVDTGVQPDHPDLQGRIILGPSFDLQEPFIDDNAGMAPM
ncbi:MAG: hypothetical protein ACE5H2_01950 [Terriglobia bacterium]